MKKILQWVLAATLISGFTVGVTSCQDNDDNPAPAKKKYRLVHSEQVNDNGSYYIADYGYDNQGRLLTYKCIAYNTPYGDLVDSDETYTYGDHYIIVWRHDDLYYRYTLNDDGLIVKEEMIKIEDGVEKVTNVDNYQYDGDRLKSYEEFGPHNLYIYHWEDGDLMSCAVDNQEGNMIKTEFTYSGLSVDHGYLIAPLSTVSKPLYIMGYYGKPSKHLISHIKTVSDTSGGTAQTLTERDYTYTIADGHIVEMVENTNSIMKIGQMERLTSSKHTITFTYEEY